ncbi:MAG: HEPN domain-containing protein [Candidatus Xenobia bacterium]
MTDENKRSNISDEVAKAKRQREFARILAASEGWEGVVSHAYYYAFHFAQALLIMEGLEARTHRGVIHLINKHFVQPGRIPPQTAQILAQRETDRLAADYDAASTFTDDMASCALADADAFVTASRSLLKEAGYL